jgi:hypothetical protein
VNFSFMELWMRRRRRGLYTFVGITLGAVAFGMWQRSVWAALFVAAIELGIHIEAHWKEN